MNFLFLRRLLTLFVLVIVPSVAYAGTYNVPSAAYPTIQSGIDPAHDGDTVLVADGTYTGPGNRDIDFHGKSLTVTSQNGPARTIIDCGGYACTDGSGNHRGFYIHSGELKATISGFTVKNGYESYVSTTSYAGGGICIFNSGGTITLTNCIVTANAAYGGGGVCNYNYGFNSSGTITLTNCTISGNSATDGGGGVYNYNYFSRGTITLTNCTITANTAAYDGGIFIINSGGTITLTNDVLYGDFGGETINASKSSPSTTVTYSNIQGGYPGTGNIDKNPLFVNAAAGDLHLKLGSPCLGAGTPIGAPPSDLDGNPRPNPPSMGAYELVLSTLRIFDAKLTIPQFINAGKGKYYLDEKVYLKGTGSGTVTGHWVVGGSSVSQVSAKQIDASSGYWTEGSEIKLPWETIKASNFIIQFSLDTPIVVQTPETSASVTEFRPDVNGWAFTNDVSTIYTIDFLHPFKFDGVCTGMVATARYYYHHQPLPNLLSIRRIRTDIRKAFNSGNDYINKVDVPRYATYPSYSQDQWKTLNETEAVKILPHLQNLDPTLIGLFTADLSANHALLATAEFSSPSMLDVDNLDFGPSNIKEVRNAQDFAVYDPNFPNEFHEVYVGNVISEARTVHFLSYTDANGSNADSSYNLHYAGFGYFSYDYAL